MLPAQDETGQLLRAMKTMVDKLKEVIGNVRETADSVATSSNELSNSAQTISSVATEQAASVEETSASMQEMGRSIQQNTDNAMQTERLASSQAVSHRDCDLGKWLYSKGIDKYGKLHEMQKLETIHEELHLTVKEIVALKNSGNTAGAEQSYLKIGPTSKEIINLLTAIEKKVS
ncbi:MAG: CZB domain-containing protein [Candidatus Magnetominusculus sp. LBB02]|nr:CZB domain-containing protein [Candidatus Magnetominusculus sp. LBB02]